MEISSRSKQWEPLGIGVVLYGYAVLLGATYLLAYWRPFGFDIFPYVSPQLLVTLPLNRLAVLFAPAVLIGMLFSLNWEPSARVPRLAFLTVVAVHLLLVAPSYLDDMQGFRAASAFYENEKSILLFVPLLCVLAGFMCYQALRETRPWNSQIASVVMLQLAAALATGYSDGKAVYIGGDRTFFLQNATACEPNPVRDWVYLGKFDSQTLFMETVEKRICILQNAQFTLVPRALADKSHFQ